MIFFVLLLLFGLPLPVSAMEESRFAIITPKDRILSIPNENLENHAKKLITILSEINGNTSIILKTNIPTCYQCYLCNALCTYLQVMTCIQQDLKETYFAIPALVESEIKAIEHIEPLRTYDIITQETFDKRKQFLGELTVLKQNTKQTRAILQSKKAN